MKTRRAKYSADLPRKMYLYFAGFDEAGGAPSFDKFARQAGLSLAELNSFRKHEKFARAYAECGEIRRDYLIDRALTRRFDPSLVKFLLERECESAEAEDGFLLRIEVEE